MLAVDFFTVETIPLQRLQERRSSFRFLIRDRDSKFSMKEGLVVNCVVVRFRHHLRVALAGAGVELCVG